MSFGDLQTTSQVSRDFFHMVRASKKFKSSVVLLLTENSAQEIADFYKTHSQPSFNGIKIDVAVPMEILHNINSILEQVHFLSFITLPREDKLPRGSLSKLVVHVLKSTSNLSHLQIDVRLMHRILYEALSYPAVQSNLKNLKKFQIAIQDSDTGKLKRPSCINSGQTLRTFLSLYSGSTPVWLQDTDPIPDSAEDIYIEEQDEEIFSKNLNLLASIQFKCLETLHVTKVQSSMFLKSILLLLENNRETLWDLSLHFNVWKNEELKTMIFPRLERLTATIDLEHQAILEAFLINHVTSLEEIDIGVRKEFKRSRFEAIQKRCTNLKKFNLKVMKMDGVMNNGHGRRTWVRLATLPLPSFSSLSSRNKFYAS